MSTFKKIVAGAYAIQLFLVVPFLGAIYRHEESLAVWRQCSVSLHRHGSGDAALCVYLYILLYSAFFVIPFYILSQWSRSHGAHADQTIGVRLLLSGWFAATLFLFADSIMEFFRQLPTDDWRVLLVIVWVFATPVAFFLFRNLRRELGVSRESVESGIEEFDKRS